MRFKHLVLGLVAFAGAFGALPAMAVPPPNISMSVGVCDPNYPTECYAKAAHPVGYQQLTSMSASTALTVPTGAVVAYVQAEAQNVRWRDDGVAPSASVGQVLTASTTSNVFTVQIFTGKAELAAVRFIQTTSGSILNVSYYK